MKQKHTSAGTSRNQEPALFKSIDWRRGYVNLDYGGGRFEAGTEYLAERGVENLVYDPFNRSKAHNKAIEARLQFEKADTATIANVLNVIAESKVRALVLKSAASMTRGAIFISTYEGDESGEGSPTRDGWQANRKTVDYLPEVRQALPEYHVTIQGKVIVARPI